MTENKRFVMYEHKDNDYILDSPNTSLDFIEMLGDALSSEEIVDRLNEQEEEISNLQLIIGVNGKAYRKSVKEYEEFIEELEQENEQLKKELKSKDKIIEMYYAMERLND